jgi:hypothetical protein
MNDENSFLFDPDGVAAMTGVYSTCQWYEGAIFPRYGRRAFSSLCALLREVAGDYDKARERGRKLSDLVRTEYTWDRAATRVLERLAKVLS